MTVIMASNHFTINPNMGIDNGTVVVTPSSTNDTQEDKIAIVTIDNGVNTIDVRVTHYGKPSIEIVDGAEPVSAPASGATYQFLVKTHYDVMFRNKPDWITIDDGQGNYITSAQTISSNVANGKTYNFNVLPNATNNSRSTSNFGLWHKIGGTVQQTYDEVSISQPQGAGDYIFVNPTSMLDWDSTTAKNITIDANVTYSVSHSNTSEFTLTEGNGYVSIKANAQNTGYALKTDTISIVSTKAGYSYTATCVVTQVRQPRIQLNSSGTINPTGGTGSVWVVSDYDWWIEPTVSPDTSPAHSYITMQGKTADTNLEPTTGSAYTLVWTSNDGNIRNDNLYVGYNKTDGTTGQSATYANFTQDRAASAELSVNPNRIPSNSGEYVSSGGGVYTVEVITNRAWKLNGTPQVCTVSPTSASAGTNVTVTVPPATHTSSSYRLVDHIYFVTNDGGQIASDNVAVFQYDNYPEPEYIVVNPTTFNVDSGTSSNNTFTVSANTNWYAYIVDTEGDTLTWMDMTTTAGTAGYTTGLHFEVNQANNSASARTGIIKFTTGSPTTVATITVNQAGTGVTPVVEDYIIPIPSTIYLDSGVSLNEMFSISANTNWVAVSSPSWVSIARGSSAGGTGYTTGLTFAVSSNSTNDIRSGYTTFTGGSASAQMLIVQSGATPTPTPPVGEQFLEITIPSSKVLTASTAGVNYGQVNLSASTDWTVDNQLAWVKVSSTFGPDSPAITGGTAGSNTLWLKVNENETGLPRIGTIDFTLVGTAITDTLTVEQEGE